MITVNYHSARDNADYELCYYLNLFDQLPPLRRRLPGRPARRVVLRRGGLCGLPRACSPAPAEAAFSEQPLTRAMLAQVLFQLAGQPDGGLTHFVDVPDTAWCYSAVSWAVSPGHHERRGRRDLRPRAPPTRQELAFTLFRYAKEAGLDTKARADLTPYSDA